MKTIKLSHIPGKFTVSFSGRKPSKAHVWLCRLGSKTFGRFKGDRRWTDYKNNPALGSIQPGWI